MTSFIPEWVSVAGPALGMHRLFKQLGDNAAVRTPLGDTPCAVQYFVEDDIHGWLALTACNAAYAELCRDQLFESEARAGLLASSAALAAMLPGLLPKVLLLWACDDDEVAALADDGLGADGVMLWSRDRFVDGGVAAIHASMRPLPRAVVAKLRRSYFPESEIQGLSVGRRNFQCDNSAILTGIFLDREQEWASKLDLALPDAQTPLSSDSSLRLINGVAGSGKTLVALQRARLLADMRPQEQVLLLIHNAPVVADLHERLQRAGRPLPANMKICTVAKWANQQWRALYGAYPVIAPDGEVLDLVHALRREIPTPRLSDQELFEELKHLNDALILNAEAYRDADRTGRGFALRELERAQVWDLYQQVGEQLRASDLRMWSDIPREVLQAPSHARLAMLDHILIDEAQFMAPAALQLVKKALKPGGSLFLCADPRQGFLRNRLSWKSVGMDVAGRTKKLRRSYRTTAALLHAATQMLMSTVDEDPEEYLTPDFGGMEQGVAPVVITAASPLDALDRLVNEVAELVDKNAIPPSTVTVIYGEQVGKSQLYAALCHRLGESRVWWLNKHRDRPPNGYVGEHLRLVNLDTATGLEGTFVFLIGVDGLLAAVASGEHSRESEIRARKLYMAMTRSCYRLCVVAAQPIALGPLSSLFQWR